MKAYLIDPFNETITPVIHNGDYKHIYKLIKADLFCIAGHHEGNDLFVDDEGLYNIPEGQDEQTFFFNPLFNIHQPMAGYGLVLGGTAEGNSTDASITLERLKLTTTFVGTRADMMVSGFLRSVIDGEI